MIDGIPAIRWVHWDEYSMDAAVFKCRFFELDGRNRIVYVHPGANRRNITDLSQDVSEGRVRFLVPNTGSKMVKATDAFRTDMNSAAITMYGFYHAMLDDDARECPVCRCNSQFSTADVDAFTKEMMRNCVEPYCGALTLDQLASALTEASRLADAEHSEVCQACNAFLM